MKKDIHPDYKQTSVTCTTCNNVFETGSTVENIKVDTCSNCHPFYTGRQRFASAAGRVEKFKQKYNKTK
ncbi:MAG: 50S ribosomal protein L31 [Erysipelotrichales bacterium]